MAVWADFLHLRTTVTTEIPFFRIIKATIRAFHALISFVYQAMIQLTAAMLAQSALTPMHNATKTPYSIVVIIADNWSHKNLL